MATPMDDVLDKDILEILGVQDLPEDKKSDLYLKLAETLQNMVVARLVDKLNKEEFEELAALMEDKKQEEVKVFMTAHNIDLKAMFVEEAFIMKAQVAALIDGIKEGENGGNTNPTA